MTSLPALALAVCSLVCTARGARVLLVHIQTLEDAAQLRQVGVELARRGHDVYAATAVNHAYKDRVTSSYPGVIDLEFKDAADPTRKHFVSSDDFVEVTRRAVFDDTYDTDTLRDIAARITVDCKNMLDDTAFFDKLRSLKLDLVLVQRVHYAQCLFLLPLALDVPYASLGAGAEAYLGARPSLPSFDTFGVAAGDWPLLQSDRKSFLDRATCLFHQVYVQLNARYDLQALNDRQLMARHDVTSYKDVIDQCTIFFMLKDYMLSWPLVTMPNAISLPPTTMADPQPLPSDLQALTEQQSAGGGGEGPGVIVVAFTSLGSTLPPDVVTKLMSAFARLPHTVIWQLDIDKVNAAAKKVVPSNVKVIKWLPHNDILAQANVKLLVTDGDNSALYQCLYHALPALVLPTSAGDHAYNAYVIEQKGYGLQLDLLTFTPDKLVEAVNQIVSNSSSRFYEKTRRASAILRDTPMTSQKAVAYWLEHVIKFGGDHLRSKAMDLAWYQYFLFDVAALLLLGAFIALYLVYRVLRFVIGRFLRLIGVVRKPSVNVAKPKKD